MGGHSLDIVIAEAAKDLYQPAGSSPHFSSLERIRKYRREYVVECHKTWKKWQEKAIHEILVFEAFARREKTHPIGPTAAEWADYNQAVWRRVNDSIIWCLHGLQRHVVKRLCLYRRRPSLSESNPRSVLSALAALNVDPTAIAIWNDATSCIDIGDLTFIQDGTKPNLAYLELKEGVANEAIAELRRGRRENLEPSIEVFAGKYGKKGIDQFIRTIKQDMIGDQMLALLHEERGVDPVTGREISVVEVTSKVESYDGELNAMLDEALQRQESVSRVIDDCLWVYADASKGMNRHLVRQNFERLLATRFPHASTLQSGKFPILNKDRIVSFNEGFAHPLALPIFLRRYAPETIGAVTFGDLMFKVFFYLDWDRFGSIVRDEGGEFLWSSEKDGRRAQAMKAVERPVIVNGRVPQIRVDAALFSVTGPMLVQLFFDGLTPRTIARQMVEVVSKEQTRMT